LPGKNFASAMGVPGVVQTHEKIVAAGARPAWLRKMIFAAGCFPYPLKNSETALKGFRVTPARPRPRANSTLRRAGIEARGKTGEKNRRPKKKTAKGPCGKD